MLNDKSLLVMPLQSGTTSGDVDTDDYFRGCVGLHSEEVAREHDPETGPRCWRPWESGILHTNAGGGGV